MKKINVALTFDDGRLDNYENALPILNKYGYKASFYIATGFIDETIDLSSVHSFESCKNRHMTIKMCNELLYNGHEIGSHSNTHCNDRQDIEISIAKIKKWFNITEIGFSSPTSVIQKNNYPHWLDETEIMYVRTSIRTDCLGFFEKLLYVSNKFLHIPFIFSFFVNKYSWHPNETNLIYSIPIEKNTSICEIKYALNHAKSDSTIVLLFHSISNRKVGNKWCFEEEKFDKICCLLQKKQINVVLLKDKISNG